MATMSRMGVSLLVKMLCANVMLGLTYGIKIRVRIKTIIRQLLSTKKAAGELRLPHQVASGSDLIIKNDHMLPVRHKMLQSMEDMVGGVGYIDRIEEISHGTNN